jgi:hypothetical protein
VPCRRDRRPAIRKDEALEIERSLGSGFLNPEQSFPTAATDLSVRMNAIAPVCTVVRVGRTREDVIVAACELTQKAFRGGRAATRGRLLLASLAGLAVLVCGGCQVDVGGQTLPSAYYLQDDIQYFPSGPEFKLSKEAAALKAYSDEVHTEGCEPCRN